VPTAAPEPALTLEDAVEHEFDALDAIEQEVAALIAQRNAEMAEAVHEYRQSGAQAPHPAWFVDAERDLELADVMYNRFRMENTLRK
jgi:hypothetical protein